MTLTNVNKYLNNLSSFVLDNKGNTKPNSINNNNRPYYVYENAVVDGIAALSTHDETIISILWAFIYIGEIDIAKSLVSDLLLNGFVFNRSSIVPGAVVYDHGETPDIQQEFIAILEILYQKTGLLTYHTTATTILNRIKSNMTIGLDPDFNTAAAPTAVLLYDAFGFLVNTYRSGSYVSDANPYMWELKGESTLASDAMEFIYNSQLNWNSDNLSNKGLFIPFFSRDLPENGAYLPARSWIFNGPLGNELSLKHSYKTILNVARYYNYIKRNKSKRSTQAKGALDSFFTLIDSYFTLFASIPTDIAVTPIDASTATVFADDIRVLASSLYSDATLIDAGTNLEFCAMVGIAALLKFDIDKEEYIYQIANNMLNIILLSLQSNGSFKIGANTFEKNQGLILEFLIRYKRITDKNYYDIINEGLKAFNIKPINDNNKLTHPFKSVLTYCQQGIVEISRQRNWEWCSNNQTLPYVAGVNTYNLDTYKIDPHRLLFVEFIENNSLLRLKQINYNDYLNWITLNTAVSRPYFYAILDSTLYIYPKPDMDYQLNIVYFDIEPDIIDYNDYPSVIPQQWVASLKYFIMLKLSDQIKNPMGKSLEFLYESWLSRMCKSDDSDTSEILQLPSKVGWDG